MHGYFCDALHCPYNSVFLQGALQFGVRFFCRCNIDDLEQMEIRRGDIYWVSLDVASGAESSIAHPHVVIQDSVINRSRITTVVVCALTTNTKRSNSPGNVLLDAGEANLPKQSTVVVSQVSTVDKEKLGAYIGTLSEQRVHQILAGMQFLQRMTERHE